MSLNKSKDDRAAAVATAPRVSKADVEGRIESTDYLTFPAEQPVLTICIVTTTTGFMVTGESACASPANFNAELGQQIAYEQAFSKLWGLEGYLLRDRLWQAEVERDVRAGLSDD